MLTFTSPAAPDGGFGYAEVTMLRNQLKTPTVLTASICTQVLVAAIRLHPPLFRPTVNANRIVALTALGQSLRIGKTWGGNSEYPRLVIGGSGWAGAPGARNMTEKYQ